MSKPLQKALIAGGIAFSSFASPAISGEKGFYGTVGIGGAGFEDTNWNFNTGGTAYDGQFKYNSGFAWEGGLGYDFGRVRTEITYTQAEAELGVATINQTNGGSISSTGGVTVSGVVASAFFDITKDTAITPYIGGGIGSFNIDADDGTIGGTSVTGSEESSFGYQVKLGASMPLGSTNHDLYAEMSYLGLEDVTVNGVNYSGLGGYGALAGLKFRF